MMMMTIVGGLACGLVYALWAIRRTKKALGLPVIGDGHVLKKWRERRKRKEKMPDVQTPKS